MKCNYCGQESQYFHENKCPYCKETVIVNTLSGQFNNNGNGNGNHSQIVKDETDLPPVIKKDKVDYYLQNSVCISYLQISDQANENIALEERHYRVHANVKLVIANTFLFVKKSRQSSWQVFQLTDLRGYMISDINPHFHNILKTPISKDLIFILNSPNAGMVLFNWKIPSEEFFLIDNIETFDNYLSHVLTNLPKVRKHSQIEQKSFEISSSVDNLKKLSELKNLGIITEHEFAESKQKLLNLL